MQTKRFNVDGMGCANCSKTVQNTLNNLDGVKTAAVDFAQKTAAVTYDETKLTEAQLKESVAEAGYQLI